MLQSRARLLRSTAATRFPSLPVPLKRTSISGRATLDRRDRPSRRHRSAARYGISGRTRERAPHRIPRGARRAADARGRRVRRDLPLAPRARPVRARSGGAGRDVCAAGGDRRRQRAPVQGNQGGARAADGNERDPARDLRLADRLQPVFETIAANALRLCGATFSICSGSTASSSTSRRFITLKPEGIAAFRAAYPLAAEPPWRHAARDPHRRHRPHRRRPRGPRVQVSRRRQERRATGVSLPCRCCATGGPSER